MDAGGQAETDAAQVVIRPLDRPGDLGWVVMAHGELYDSEFGWDTSFEALVARSVADYAAGHDPGREAAWIAELDGVRVGCVFCVAEDEQTAKLRILLVLPAGRATVWGVAWSIPVWRSPTRLGTRGCGCGPTTRWSRPAGSICSGGSCSPSRNRTTASVSTWSARFTSANWTRAPRTPPRWPRRKVRHHEGQGHEG